LGAVCTSSTIRIKLTVGTRRLVGNTAITNIRYNYTDDRKSPQKAQPEWENSSLGFVEAVHQAV